MAASNLMLRFDTSEVAPLIDELKLNLDRCAQFPNLLADVLNLFSEFPELVTTDCECGGAMRTGEVTVFIQPTDRFLKLIAALRAIKGDFHVVDG